MTHFTLVKKTLLLLHIFTFCLSNAVLGQFSGGDGTATTPYQVATAADLNNVRNYLDAHFKQTAHIDLNESPYNSGSGWEPIGTDATNPTNDRFRGNYNGQGYEIQNLFINRPNTDNVGLFGCLEQGTETDPVVVRNVNLVTIQGVAGARGTGSLVGRVRGNIYTLIEGCSASGTGVVSGNGATGGLVGANNSYQESPGGEENPIISMCYADIKVEAVDGGEGDKIGGLVGCNQKGTTIDSYAWGAVEVVGTGTFERVGGLAGCADLRGRIIHSYSTGTVSINSSSTTLVGGLVGHLGTGAAPNRGTVTDSYWLAQLNTSSAGGTMLTHEEMLVSSNFSGFDFTKG